MVGRECDAGISNRGGGDAAGRKATRGAADAGKLRGGFRLFKRADYRESPDLVLGDICTHSWIQTLEVATARVYNWDVTMKRKEKAESGQEVVGKTNVLPIG